MLHPTRLSQSVADLAVRPPAELGVLMLPIFLTNPPMPQGVTRSKESNTLLFAACKLLFLQIQAFRGDRIETVQAGALLAVHEQGVDFCPALQTPYVFAPSCTLQYI